MVVTRLPLRRFRRRHFRNSVPSPIPPVPSCPPFPPSLPLFHPNLTPPHRLNTFVGQLQNSTALLGVLHSFYGLGCAISPIVATKMVEAGLGWNSYYYVLLGWGVVNTLSLGVTYHPGFMRGRATVGEQGDMELEGPGQGTSGVCLSAPGGEDGLFGSSSCNDGSSPVEEDGMKIKDPEDGMKINAVPIDISKAVKDITTIEGPGISPKKPKGPLSIILTNRFCWLVALYLVLYLGLEISTGGWVVEFMIQVPPHTSPLACPFLSCVAYHVVTFMW